MYYSLCIVFSRLVVVFFLVLNQVLCSKIRATVLTQLRKNQLHSVIVNYRAHSRWIDFPRAAYQFFVVSVLFTLWWPYFFLGLIFSSCGWPFLILCQFFWPKLVGQHCWYRFETTSCICTLWRHLTYNLNVIFWFVASHLLAFLTL